MTSHPQPYPKGESLKPSISELERIEADYDPEKEYDDPRVDYLVAKLGRPHR